MGDKKIRFNKKTIYWLGDRLDNQLKLMSHINEKMKRACIAEIQLKSPAKVYGLVAKPVRQIQLVVIQFMALYSSEL